MATPKPDEAAIFNAARRIADPLARRQYIAEACGEDLALAGRVEALLRAHDEGPPFLGSPTKELADFLCSLPSGPPGRPRRVPAPTGPPLPELRQPATRSWAS